EAMTFEQLAQLNPRALLDKRSFTPQKLTHLVSAVERALDRPRSESTSNTGSPAATHPPTHFTTASPISIARWRSQSGDLPATLAALLMVYAEETTRIGSGSTELLRALQGIPEQLSAQEYLAAALREEYDLATVGALLKIDPNTAEEARLTAYRKTDDCLKMHAPALRQSLLLGLSHPATSLSSLQSIISPEPHSSPVLSTITAIFARALGAAPVQIGNITDPAFWSTNGEAAQRAVRLLVAGLPKSASELQADAAALLPGTPFTTVSLWLKPLAQWNEREQRWSKLGDS
ncbi:MAG: hypothetical protein EBZ48_10930, partial [Proteobacteria bacterium]|nr:hypothetical protein [Pseudomonadota bacterium]